MFDKTIKFVNNNVFINILVIILYVLIYYRSLSWALITFTDSSSYEYGILFLLIAAILGFNLYQKSKTSLMKVEYHFDLLIFSGFIATLLVNSVNIQLFHLNILSSLCFLLGLYFLACLYVKKIYHTRILYLFALICLSLPILDHLQVFMGFPLRLLTAKIIANLFNLMNIHTITESNIIILENTMTTIDTPCSGIKSIYVGFLFMLFIYFYKNAALSLKLLLISAFYIFMIFIFNCWRVFTLVFIDSILKLNDLGSIIHNLLGIIAFVIACGILWFLSEHYIASKNTFYNEEEPAKSKRGFNILLSCLVLFNLLNFIPVSSLVDAKKSLVTSKTFPAPLITGYKFTAIPLEEKEARFWAPRPDIIVQKYKVTTRNNLTFFLLIISSPSWRLQHNPEICLKGQGYNINNAQVFSTNKLMFKRLSLNDGNTFYYWFSDGNKTTVDYSGRVWDSFMSPGKSWTLLELGFNKPVDLSNPDTLRIFEEINNLTKKDFPLSSKSLL